MAETEFILSQDEWTDFLVSLHSEGASFVHNTQSKSRMGEVSEEEIRALSKRSSGLFLKHPSFSDGIFNQELVNNIHSGHIYMYGGLGGDGHISISNGRTEILGNCFSCVSISYHYSFSDGNANLVTYYRKLVARLKRDAKRYAMPSGRAYWVRPPVFNLAPDFGSVLRDVFYAHARAG